MHSIIKPYTSWIVLVHIYFDPLHTLPQYLLFIKSTKSKARDWTNKKRPMHFGASLSSGEVLEWKRFYDKSIIGMYLLVLSSHMKSVWMFNINLTMLRSKPIVYIWLESTRRYIPIMDLSQKRFHSRTSPELKEAPKFMDLFLFVQTLNRLIR